MPSPHSKAKTRPRRGLSGPQPFYSASFPSDSQTVEPIVHKILRAVAREFNLDGQMSAVELSLREALANAVLHGNRGDRRKHVRVECFRDADGSLVLVVRDTGPGFDPERVKDPTQPENLFRDCGRGIFLIRHFMDDVEFARGGREIRMRKNP